MAVLIRGGIDLLFQHRGEAGRSRDASFDELALRGIAKIGRRWFVRFKDLVRRK